MTQRINYFQVSPKVSGKLFELSQAMQAESLDPELYEMVHILASIRNGCAFCLDLAAKKAKLQGADDIRLFHIPAWRDSNLFSAKEKAAFAWTEAATNLPADGISDELYEHVRKHLSEKEIVDLSFAVSVINVWNRLNACFKTVPGSLDEQLGLKKANNR